MPWLLVCAKKKPPLLTLGDLALGALNAQLGSFQLLLLPLLPLNMLLLLQATCAIESDLAREVDHAGPHNSRYRLEATLQSVMDKASVALLLTAHADDMSYSKVKAGQTYLRFVLEFCRTAPIGLAYS